MARYLLLKHYRGDLVPEIIAKFGGKVLARGGRYRILEGPEKFERFVVIEFPSMDQWTPDEVDAHMQYMRDFATRLEGSGEVVEGQALSQGGMWVRSDGAGKPPVTDGTFAETKDLIAGWMIVDVDSEERAIELAGELSAAPGAGGKPIQEWLEVRPFMTAPPTITE